MLDVWRTRNYRMFAAVRSPGKKTLGGAGTHTTRVAGTRL